MPARGGMRDGAGRKGLKGRRDVQFMLHVAMFETLEKMRVAGAGFVPTAPRSTWYRRIVLAALECDAEVPRSPMRNAEAKRQVKVALSAELFEQVTRRAADLGIGHVAGFVRSCLAWYIREQGKTSAATESEIRRLLRDGDHEADQGVARQIAAQFVELGRELVRDAGIAPDVESRDVVPVPVVTELSPEDLAPRLHEMLLGEGMLERDAVVRRVADVLRVEGEVSFSKLNRRGQLYGVIDAALVLVLDGARSGTFEVDGDEMCATLCSARDYTDEHWRMALLSCLGPERIERSEAIEAAAAWAAEMMGLEFDRLPRNGRIFRGLDGAIESALRRGEMVETRSKIQKVVL